MKLPSYADAVFALDPEQGLDANGLFVDSGPHQLNFQPVNFVAPNYGLLRGPSGAACIRFNGTTQYAQLTGAAVARFYAVAPTTDLTLAVVARHTVPGAGSFLFNARNAAATRGVVWRYSTTETGNLRTQDSGGVQTNLTDAASVPLTGRTRISAYSLVKGVPSGLIWHDGSGLSASVAGNANAVSYDVSVVPTVGSQPGGGGYFNGDLYFLGLFGGSPWTLAEYQAFYRYWADRC